MKMNKNQADVLNEIYELKELEEKYKRIKSQYEAKKLKLSDSIKAYMSKVKCENLRYKGGIAKRGIKATKVCPKKIIWDVDKLEKKLDRKLFKEITKKKYQINDMENLVKYLKSCGVDSNKFKTFINVEKVVDQKKIDNLSKIGEIELDDLDGCYEVKELSSYLKIEYLENIEKDED